jgi:hypothetical protein
MLDESDWPRETVNTSTVVESGWVEAVIRAALLSSRAGVERSRWTNQAYGVAAS